MMTQVYQTPDSTSRESPDYRNDVVYYFPRNEIKGYYKHRLDDKIRLYTPAGTFDAIQDCHDSHLHRVDISFPSSVSMRLQ